LAVQQINIDYLTQNREQFFAQAAAEVLGGAAWWLESADEERLHRAVAEEHTEIDPWDAPVADYMKRTPADGLAGVGSEDVLRQVTGKDMATWSSGDTRRVCAILTRQGAQRGRGRSRYRWFWGPGPAQTSGER
jgi:predicted P-loop ATPase